MKKVLFAVITLALAPVTGFSADAETSAAPAEVVVEEVVNATTGDVVAEAVAVVEPSSDAAAS